MLSCRPLRPGEGRHWYFDPTLFPSEGHDEGPGALTTDDAMFEFDAATRRSIHSSPYRSHLETLIAIEGAFGVFRGSMCLGLVAAQPLGSGRTWLLWECLVQPSLRRQGLGRRLVARLATGLAAQGAEGVLCQLGASHEVGRRFLEACGFRLAGMDAAGAEALLFYRLDLTAGAARAATPPTSATPPATTPPAAPAP